MRWAILATYLLGAVACFLILLIPGALRANTFRILGSPPKIRLEMVRDVDDQVKGLTDGLEHVNSSFFGGRRDVSVQTSPSGLVTLDVENDRLTDIAVCNANSNSISIISQMIGGSLLLSATYTVGSFPYDICASDFNADGFSDIALTNLGDSSQSVGILLNNGNGGFVGMTAVHVGQSPVSLCTGDFDQDGDIDIAVTSANAYDVEILTNSGSGAFAVSSTITFGAFPIQIESADLNGDGWPDLVTSLLGFDGQDSVSVLFNNGSGSFVSRTNHPLLGQPGGVALADFNNDGTIDVAAVNNSSLSSISIFQNTGGGTLAAPVNYVVQVNAHSLQAADFDRDGNIDLVCANQGSNSISLLRNLGTGQFELLENGAVASWPFGLACGDLNQDGKIDVATANFSSNSVSVLLNLTSATTIRVPSQQSRIQDAIDLAANQDTVSVAPGTYVGAGNRDLQLRGKKILVRGESSSSAVTISLAGLGDQIHCGFQFSELDDSSAVIDGFSIVGGRSFGSPTDTFVSGVQCKGAYTQAPRMRNLNISKCYYGIHGLSGLNLLDVVLDSNAVAIGGFNTRLIGCRLSNSELRILDSPTGIAMAKQCIFENGSFDPYIFSCDSVNFDSCQFISISGYPSNFCFPSTVLPEFRACEFKRTQLISMQWQAKFVGCTFDSVWIGQQGGSILKNCKAKNSKFTYYESGGFNLDSCYLESSVVWPSQGESIITNTLFKECNPAIDLFDWVPGMIVHVSNCSFLENRKCINYPEWSQRDIRFERSLFAFNDTVITQIPGYPDSTTELKLNCNDFFGNTVGFVGLADPIGANENIDRDPMICSNVGNYYTLWSVSPCLAENNTCSSAIGSTSASCNVGAMISLLSIDGQESPSNVVNHLPTILWSYVRPGAASQESFEFAVGTDTNWDYAEMWNPSMFVSPDTTLSYDGATLLDGVTYWLRIRQEFSGNWSPWYEKSFRMNSVPSVPTLSSPASDAVASGLPVLSVLNSIDLDGDLLNYDFQIFGDSTLSTLLDSGTLIPQALPATSWTAHGGLPDNQRCWWRSRCTDGYEYSAWSEGRPLWINSSQEAPQPPILLDPPISSEIIIFDLKPEFRWTMSIDPDPGDTIHYKLDLSLNSSFTLVIPFDALIANHYKLADSLQFGKHYWWRVRAIDKTGLESPFSVSKDFWTWELGDIDGSHGTDIADLSRLIDYLYISFSPIVPKKLGDLDGDCTIDISDLSRIIDRLYISFTPLGVGCE